MTVAGVTASAPFDFQVRPWPELRDAASAGSPVFFHGPRGGTPTLGKKDQRVLVIFANPSDGPPVDPATEIAAEMATFADAQRFWREASYGRTTLKFEKGPRVNLPKPRNTYVWDSADIDFARDNLLRMTKRWAHIVGTRVYCAHQGGGLAVADISVNNWPQEVARLAPGWVAFHVVVQGSTAFVAADDDGLVTVDVGSATPVQLGQVAFGGRLRGCDVSGNTLVAAAREGGVEVYDVNNPASPVRRAVIDNGSDWATAVKVVGNRAFVGAGNRLRIYDVSNPAAPVRTGEADAGAWVVGQDVTGGTCVVATDGNGLAIFDVSGPTPVPKASIKDVLRLHGARIFGTLAYVACGSDGLMIVDVAAPAVPVRLATKPTGGSCYDVAGTLTSAVLSLGGNGVAPGDASDPKHPLLGIENFLTATPPLGGDPDLAALRINLTNAINSQGLMKGFALIVHGLLEAKAVNPGIDFDAFEGFVVVIQGSLGRGQSWTSSGESFDGKSVSFAEEKGLIWLASRSAWGRKAHEVGHWFGMPDIYSEWYDGGTFLSGDAAAWDLAGNHDEGPLFSGKQANHMQLFDGANVVRREWDPSAGPTNEPFDIVAHGATQDTTTDRIHLLELKVAAGLSYYVEVRQKPGTVIFDANIPVPAGATGRVLITRVTEGASISNTFERPTMLMGVLDTGDSAVDAARLLRIEVVGVVQPNPLVYKVVVHWNEEPPPTPDGKFDLTITPWSTDTWETPDIWVNSPRNDGTSPDPIYAFHEPGDEKKPILNGDKPWVKRQNTIFARISNTGIQPVKDVYVTCYVTSPPGIGDNGNWQTLKSEKLTSIGANSSEVVKFTWAPAVDKHTCIAVAVMPKAGEIEPKNNRAQENVASFDSAGSSSHEPVMLETEVRSPFSVWRRVDLRVRGLPLGWHAAADKAWVWVEPKGSVPVTVVIWTDLDSPRAHEGQRIPAEARPRVEGWTDFGAHRHLPIGGILAPVRANKRTRIVFEASSGEGRIRIMGFLKPPTPGIPGVVEVTDAVGAARHFPITSDASGRLQADILVGKGRYDVQIFTASTPKAAETESEVRHLVVPG